MIEHTYSDGTNEWRVADLWQAAASVPVEALALSDLSEVTCLSGWWWEPEPTFVNFVDHCRRVLDADLAYPILLGPRGEVLDGMHRIAKAMVHDVENILVQRLATMPEPTDEEQG